MPASGVVLAFVALISAVAYGQAPVPPVNGSVATSALEANLLPGRIHAAQVLMAAHPEDASTHIAYSAALLEAGAGDDAQAEARLATTLNPQSGAAFAQLADTLMFNSIGVRFGSGFPRGAAIEAGRTAVKLEPKNAVFLAALARLYDVILVASFMARAPPSQTRCANSTSSKASRPTRLPAMTASGLSPCC